MTDAANTATLRAEVRSAIHPADRHRINSMSPYAVRRLHESITQSRRLTEQRQQANVRESITETIARHVAAATPPRQRMEPQAARDALMREARRLAHQTGRSEEASLLQAAADRRDLVSDAGMTEGIEAVRRRYFFGGHHAGGCRCLDCARTANA